MDDRGVVARYGGVCRGCELPFKVGDRIRSEGRGQGAYHVRCFRRPKPHPIRAEIDAIIKQWTDAHLRE